MSEKKTKQPSKKKPSVKKTKAVGKPDKTVKTKKTEKKTPRITATKPLDFPIVALGASAGGLEALEVFFSNMPSDSNMAFVVIQHLSPKHKSIMGSLLQRSTEMEVFGIENGMKIQPNCIYLNPPDRNVVIQYRKLHLMMPDRTGGINLPIDCFFRSMASDLGEKAICIILSGTATDGTLGLKEVKGGGGIAMVQDPLSAKYDGMPRSAISTGIVDFILPVEKLPAELIKYSHAPYLTLPQKTKPADDSFSGYIQTIFALIRKSTGHDLSHYKQTTIRRRIERRMAVHQVSRIADYVKFLEKTTSEVTILFKDMLIGVTNFFRDTEPFKILKEQVLPGLFKNRQPDSQIRIWIVGCSTGEEAYSMTILLLEVMEMTKQHHAIQVFASDIDADAIERARLGVYPDSIVADVSPERLSKYFIREDNTYRIKKQIREMVIFAVHNAIKDPPFSKIDVLSCRNMLIYMDAPLQKKIMPLFHYTLRPHGVMLLGTSESIGEFNDLFSPLSSKWKIYQKQESYLEKVIDYPMLPFYYPRQTGVSRDKVDVDHDLHGAAEQMILSDYAPPGVLVNEHHEIIRFLGKTDKFLEAPVGKASFNILSMAREGLRFKLGTALHNAVRGKKTCSFEDVRVKCNGDVIHFNLIVRPLMKAGSPSGYYLVMFDEKARFTKPIKEKKGKNKMDDTNPALISLERELNVTKEHLQITIEELETSNEELKSTNEELQSVNEELQSTNEELETSKEELQSTNEELVTVNTELQKKVDELSEASNDINNLLASTEIGTIFLDTDLKIRRFTPAATKIFNLIESDVGRSISDITSTIPLEQIQEDMRHVLKTLEKTEKEIQNRNTEWFSVRIIPYRTLDNVIDGIVVTFNNFTKFKRVEIALTEAEERLKLIVEAGEDVINLIDLDGKYLYYNGPELFKLTSETVVGKSVFDIFDASMATTVLEQIKETARNKQGHYYETSFTWQGKKLFYMDYRYPLLNADNMVFAVGTVSRNITELKNKEETLALSEQRFQVALKHFSIIVAHADLDLRYTWIYDPSPDFDPTSFLGKRDDEIASNEGTKALVQLKKEVIRTGKATRKTISFLSSGGITKYDVTGEPLRDLKGKVIGVTTASMEISRRQ